jgi:hypothetical protein
LRAFRQQAGIIFGLCPRAGNRRIRLIWQRSCRAPQSCIAQARQLPLLRSVATRRGKPPRSIVGFALVFDHGVHIARGTGVQNQRGARPSVHRPKKRRTIATRRLIRRLSPSCPLAGCEARCEHSPSAAWTIRHAEACQEGGSARVRAGGQIGENLLLARAISALASGRSWTHPEHLH